MSGANPTLNPTDLLQSSALCFHAAAQESRRISKTLFRIFLFFRGWGLLIKLAPCHFSLFFYFSFGFNGPTFELINGILRDDAPSRIRRTAVRKAPTMARHSSEAPPLSKLNVANVLAFVANMVVATAIGAGAIGETNAYVGAK